MHECAKPVDKIVGSPGKVRELFTKSTGFIKYLTSQVFVRHGFCASNLHIQPVYQHAGLSAFNLFGAGLCPLSTNPMITTNLIKD